MPTEPPAASVERWRRILRAARAARQASRDMGPRGVARAVAYELVEAPAETITATRCVLASLAAKGGLGAGIDLDELDRALRRHHAATEDIARRGAWKAARRRQSCQQEGEHRLGKERPYLLRVEDARALPILELLDRLGFQFRRVGREYLTRCPFHDDRRPSLQVNPARGLWHCFVCGIGGDGIAFVMRLKGVDFAGAVREVAGC